MPCGYTRKNCDFFLLAKPIWNNKISTITLYSEGGDTTTVRFNIHTYIFLNNLAETQISLNFLSSQHGAQGTLENWRQF